jgi:translation initiation factor eIF-2B subunit epsilon
VVDEDALVEWRSLSAAVGESAPESEREKYKEVYLKGKQYVDVLEDMDSDDDDDDEDEDDDEDSDDE